MADPLSGCQMLESAVARFDAILRQCEFAAAHRPDVVLQLGMPPASKVLAQWLAGSKATHVAVSPVGSCLRSEPGRLASGPRIDRRAVLTTCCRGDAPKRTAWLEEWLEATGLLAMCSTTRWHAKVSSPNQVSLERSPPGIPSAATLSSLLRCRCAMSNGSARHAAMSRCTRTAGLTGSTASSPPRSVSQSAVAPPRPCCWVTSPSATTCLR